MKIKCICATVLYKNLYGIKICLWQLIVMYKFLFDNVKEIDNLEIGYKHEFMFTTKQHIQYDKFKTVVIDIV